MKAVTKTKYTSKIFRGHSSVTGSQLYLPEVPLKICIPEAWCKVSL